LPRVDPDLGLVPSVLDRLIVLRPKVSTEPQETRSHRLAQMKVAVKRDLEWLLNTKRPALDLPEAFRQLDWTALTFGLPDLTTSSLKSPDDQHRLRRVVLEAIRRYEPRLTQVTVTLEKSREFERALRFRIDALLLVEPTPEPVTFDSMLQLQTKSFVVQDGPG